MREKEEVLLISCCVLPSGRKVNKDLMSLEQNQSFRSAT